MSVQSPVPAHVPSDLVRHWDHWYDPDLKVDPWRWFRENNDTRAFFSTAYDGFWVLMWHQDIREAYRNSDLFTVDTLFQPQQPREHRYIPGELNPPEHTKYRRMLMPLVSPERVRAMADSVRALAVEVIEAVQDQGECDFMRDVARPFHRRFFAGQIGLAEEDSARFMQLGRSLIDIAHPEQQEAAHRGVDELIATEVRERLRTGSIGEDWISTIVHSRVDGELLSEEDMINTSTFLFLAGLVTTPTLLGRGIEILAERPAERKFIAASLPIPQQALEEMLRHFAHTGPFHEVKDDMEYAGVEMRKGDLVLLPTQAANHDHRVFEDPDVLNFQRPNADRHIAFGVGRHRCFGERLVELEFRVILEEWHRRIPDYRIVDGTVLEWGGATTILELQELPIEWSTKV